MPRLPYRLTVTRLVAILVIIAAAAPLWAQALTPIDVGDRKQLFIDDRFIADSTGITLTMNPPRKVPRADAGPQLGLPENRDLDFGPVLVDPAAPPEQRYKKIALEGRMSETETAGIFIYYSPDRVNWTRVPARVFPFWPDGENSLMYDPSLGKYVAFFRQWHTRSPGTYVEAEIKPLRTVGRLVIDDPLQPWPIPEGAARVYLWGESNLPAPGPAFETVLACDEHDPPESDFYDHGILRYPWADEVYVAFPVLYRHFPGPPEGQLSNDGLTDVQLATSRDGITWRRFRGSYIRLGEWGSPDGGCIYTSRALLRNGDVLWQYYSGYARSHGTPAGGDDNPAFAGMVEQRLDGFVSADAAYVGGELTSPPIIFAGSRLELNVDCSAAGDVRVELLDADGEPLPGYALGDADMIRGNHIRAVATWHGESDVATLAGRPIRLRFGMRAAKLYAFQFVAEPLAAG